VAANDARNSGTAGSGHSVSSGGEGYRAAPLCSRFICDPEFPPSIPRGCSPGSFGAPNCPGGGTRVSGFELRVQYAQILRPGTRWCTHKKAKIQTPTHTQYIPPVNFSNGDCNAAFNL
jgi:hypothetical protein